LNSTANATDYNLNCFGVVCGGLGPYASCANAQVAVDPDGSLIIGFIGRNSFNGELDSLSFNKSHDRAIANSKTGSVRFEALPVATAVIEGFGFREKIEINCRAFHR
jgi:hypothetical protein